MILVIAEIDGTSYKISDKVCQLESLYSPYIYSFDNPTRYITYPSGGRSRIEFGSISILLQFFSNISEWPPPRTINFTIKLTDTTESEAITVFAGIGERENIYDGVCEYNLIDTVVATNLLENTNLTWAWSAEFFRIAFGEIDFIQAENMFLYSPGNYRYHMAGLSQSGITVYLGETDITSSCTFLGDGTFTYTSHSPSAMFMSGVGEVETLTEVAEYICGILGLSYNDDKAASPSPTVGVVVNEQTGCLPFLENLCVSFCHFFYIDGGTLYLIDMEYPGTETTLTENDFLSVKYGSRRQSLSTITCEYITREIDINVIVESTETITLYGDDPDGSEYEYYQGHSDRDEIITMMSQSIGYFEIDTITMSVPISTSMPSIGDRLSFYDSKLPESTLSSFSVRNITCDFVNMRADLSGDGWIGDGLLFPVQPFIITGFDYGSLSSVPYGWQIFTDAEDCFLVGAGSTYSVNETGGSSTADMTLNTSGSHTGTLATNHFMSGDGTPPTDSGIDISNSSPIWDHTHAVSADYTPAYQDIILIQSLMRAEKFPEGSILLYKSNSAPTGYEAFGDVTSDRLLRCQTSIDYGDVDVVVNSVSTVGSHAHATLSRTSAGGSVRQDIYESAGVHSHTVLADFVIDIKRSFVRAYKALSDNSGFSSMIAMCASDSIPSGWVACDGSGGTPDLRDYFIANSSDATQSSTGDNSMSTLPSTSGSAHEHDGGDFGFYTPTEDAYHAAGVVHYHTSPTLDAAYLPKYYAFVFITYTG